MPVKDFAQLVSRHLLCHSVIAFRCGEACGFVYPTIPERLYKKDEKSNQKMAMDLPDLIRQLRKQASLTQVDLAHELGLTPTSVFRYEAGRSIPSTDTMLRLLELGAKYKFRYQRELSERIDKRVNAVRKSAEAWQERHVVIGAKVAAEVSPANQQLVLAFIRFLEHEKDERLLNVAMTLCAPWMEVAMQELKLGEKNREAGRGTKEEGP